MGKRTISATEARVHFGELLDSVAQHNDVVYVQRGGVPKAVLVPVAEWERHTSRDPWEEAARSMEEHWEYMRKQREAGLIKDMDIDAAELIRQGRAERDEQLLGDLLGQ